MNKPKNITFISILTISIFLLTYVGSTISAQTSLETIVHLPIIVLNNQFLGFEPVETDDDFEQKFSAPLVGVTDHRRVLGYVSGATFFNPYSNPTFVEQTSYNLDGIQSSGTESIRLPEFDTRTIFPLITETTDFASFELATDLPVTPVFIGLTNDFSDESYFRHIMPPASTEIYLPLLCKCEYETVIGIQNTNDTYAVIQVTYSDGESFVVIIPAHSQRLVYQYFEEHGSEPFSGILTSTLPVSAAVFQTDFSTNRAYAGLINSSPTLFFPLVNFDNESTAFTDIQIQNTGSESTEVTITYTPTTSMSTTVSANCTETQTIGAQASVTFARAAFSSGANSTCVLEDSFVGSARVSTNSTNQPLAGAAEITLNSLNIGSYGALTEQEPTSRISFPEYLEFIRESDSANTHFYIFNVGSSASDVTCYFTADSRISGMYIPAGEMVTLTVDAQSAEVNAGGAACVGGTGSQIVGVADIRQFDGLGETAENSVFTLYRGINF